ncbi:uncharacterized protein BCR38DRAFT_183835 [Pseudomassariella vexata]|uniref:Uncharacterized protein n=1 Tax=Pseudomassariella vexata TaxID=1141098 RepID=A0A1Y2E592_9PEZI|nr:uncharacterized protein BCR38DRAFT_183835 [Pseudomassariella vexata]ORY66607.1 hypothetical protein BCR38DRAFT_183835 [Pseudomassariella vexata]
MEPPCCSRPLRMGTCHCCLSDQVASLCCNATWTLGSRIPKSSRSKRWTTRGAADCTTAAPVAPREPQTIVLTPKSFPILHHNPKGILRSGLIGRPVSRHTLRRRLQDHVVMNAYQCTSWNAASVSMAIGETPHQMAPSCITSQSPSVIITLANPLHHSDSVADLKSERRILTTLAHNQLDFLPCKEPGCKQAGHGLET